MEKTKTIHPNLTVLDDAQKDKIHTDSLQVLATIGVRVDSAPARQLFTDAIGTEATREDRVYIPAELVEYALKLAPSSVDIYNRRGDLAFRLPGQTRFGIGVTALYYQNPETDKIAPFTRQHMETTVRLGDILPNFDTISTIGIIQDVSPEQSDFYATLEMMANTIKPLVILVSDERVFPAVLDLLAHLHGDLALKSFIIPYFNPISPLVINEGTADKMFAAIERGLTFIYSNYGMAGATTPITPAGSLILLNAELLAGLTLIQLIKEGASAIFGSLPASFNMKGKGSFYDPRGYLLNLVCAEMMDHYHLPHCGTSGSGMGWGADLFAAGHQWTNHVTSCIGRVGLAPFVGNILDSITFSPAIITYANEIIEQARLFTGGFDMDDTSTILTEIAQAGPGGNFLTSDLTFQQFRQAQYHSDIFPRLTPEEWQTEGFPRADNYLRQYTNELMSNLDPPGDHEDLMAKGEAFICKLVAR